MKTIRDLFSSKKFLAMLSAIVVYVVGRFGFDVQPSSLDPIWQIIVVYIGAQGVADAGKSAAIVKAAAPPPVVVAQNYAGSTYAPIAGLLAVLALGLVATQPSCAEVRPRAAAGISAMIDCEDSNLKFLATEAYELAEAALLSTISGDGKTVDRTKLRTALEAVKSDGLRCAVAAAVVALTAPTKSEAVERRSIAATRSDTGGLREAFATVAAELKWPLYRVAQ